MHNYFKVYWQESYISKYNGKQMDKGKLKAG